MLEVGPGWGAFAAHVARQWIKVTGVTISRQSLNIMNRLAAEENLPKTTLMSDFLEFKSEKQFNAVVVLGIMEHMPDYAWVFAHIDRLLKVASGRLNVSQGKIRAFEKKWVAAQFRERIGEAVSEIQRRGMIPLAETPQSPTGGGIFRRYWHQLDFRFFQEPIKFVSGCRPAPALDN